MARTRTVQTPPATVTVNAIDKIVAQLNTLDGIEFAKDAWVNKAPKNYGVVELSGTARQLWADGHLIDSIWNVAVYAYVKDDSNPWPERIQQKLEELEAESNGRVDLPYSINREFDNEINRVTAAGISSSETTIDDKGVRNVPKGRDTNVINRIAAKNVTVTADAKQALSAFNVAGAIAGSKLFSAETGDNVNNNKLASSTIAAITIFQNRI